MRRALDIAGLHASVVLCASVLLSSMVLSASVAEAQGAVQAARAHYQAGVSYYESARYEDAVHEFETAYQLSTRVELLFNISQCYERLGNLPEAIRYLESFVEGTDDDALRELQQERLRNLRSRWAAEERDAQPAPEREPPELGRVEIQPEPEEPTTGGVRKAGFAVVAVGGAFALSFAVAGGLALAEDSDLDDRCGTETCDSSDTTTLRRRLRFADVSLAIGLVALTAGILMIVLDQPDYDVALGPGTLRLRARF